MTHEKDRQTGLLFGSLFPAYDDRAFLESLQLLKRRFDENDFDTRWFEGKRILDAGCGGGRYSLACAIMGAEHVTGVDLGEVADLEAKGQVSAAEARELAIGQGHHRFVAWKNK